MPSAPTETAAPLYVDLDGTLTRSDTLWESFAQALRRRPVNTALLTPVVLAKGRPALKQWLAARGPVDAALLPYSEDVLALIRAARSDGRRVVLATAADVRLAHAIADHLQLFDDVLASDGDRNLKAHRKLEAIRTDAGGVFDYVGDSAADESIWAAARHAYRVGGADDDRFEAVLPRPRTARSLWRAMRPHQWAKNLLVVAPLLLAHELTDPAKWLAVTAAFVAMCVCASSVYLVNDLADIESDRRHPTKRRRPFASGDASIPHGLALAAILPMLGLLVAGLVSTALLATVALYLVVTTAYTFDLKRRTLIDVITLAGLFTLRLGVGVVAAGVMWSPWLLAFSLFLFFSLALAKRYAELDQLRATSGADRAAAGRGYTAGDLPIVGELGVGSGLLSVLVFTLYISGADTAAEQYPSRDLLWLLCPLLLYWIGRIWILTRRGEMPEDPVTFALKDRATYAVAAITVAIAALSASRVLAG